MNEELQQLQANFAAMRAELGELKARLSKLESVVSIDESRDGQGEEVTIECTTLVVRPWKDRRLIAIHLGTTDDGGGYIDVHYPGQEDGAKTALSMGMQDDGQPHVRVMGKDWKMRTEMTIDNDHGVMAVLAPDHKPGAVMRALPGGGSVAVLQPDGKARAVLIHDENHANPHTNTVTPSTSLIFATGDAKTLMKLDASTDGSLICMGRPGQPDAMSLVTRDQGPTIMMKSANDETSVTIAAMKGLARVATNQGKTGDKKAEASLMAGAFGSSMELLDTLGGKRVDIMASDNAGNINLLDKEDKTGVVLGHFAGSHSTLAMHGPNDHECVRFMVDNELTGVRIVAPENAETGFLTTVQKDKASYMLHKDKHTLAFMGECEQGGVVSAFGKDPEKAGSACIMGGPVAGALVLALTDGTSQLTLDSTDHGGRLMINNDLGFQRIAMGVYQESAGLHMNHTGSLGVQAMATPKGGIVAVCNSEGRFIDTMPKGEVEEDDSERWGKMPGDD